MSGIIGRGGMATVYRLRHRTLHTLHALKVLTVDDAELRARSLAEGRMLARMRHPNLVSVTDVLEVNGAPGLLLELVDGPDMAQWLGGRAVPWSEAEPLFRGIVAGVARAHAEGLVHRDLKPANVLLAGDVPKVADFGIARLVEQSGDALTASDVGMGTPGYMAPEQYADARRVTQQADIWSLGCILYEMVCGEPPFRGTVGEIIRNSALGMYAAPESHAPSLPPQVRAAIQGCLRPEPSARLQGCAALLATLDAPPSATTGPISRAPARAGVGVALLALVALTGLAGAAWWATTRDDAVDPGTTAVVTEPAPEASAPPPSEPAVAPSPAPEPPPDPALTPPTPARSTAPASPPVAAAVAPAVAPPVTTTTGTLRVLCLPKDTHYCRAVAIDQARHTTGLTSLAVSAGPHTITVEGPDGLTASVTATVQGGALTSIRCVFDAVPPRCSVQ